MLKTQEEFLEWLGLKLGDRIEMSTEYQIIKINNCYYVQTHYNLHPISYLIGKEFHKLPAPKKYGELLCDNTIDCTKCPLRWLCDNHYHKPTYHQATLYKVLDMYDITDLDVYNALRKKLDKVVE